MKAAKWGFALFALAAVAFAVLFPVFARGPQDVYRKVLWMHQDIDGRPHRNGKLPFLYVSWFRNGSLKWGEEFVLYGSGRLDRRRVLTYATEGGFGPMQDKRTFQALWRVSALPPGLPGPDAAPHGRLLIVSLCHNRQWVTGYYDRRALPVPVQALARLIDGAGINQTTSAILSESTRP